MRKTIFRGSLKFSENFLKKVFNIVLALRQTISKASGDPGSDPNVKFRIGCAQNMDASKVVTLYLCLVRINVGHRTV
jgi:hypothetical protein